MNTKNMSPSTLFHVKEVYFVLFFCPVLSARIFMKLFVFLTTLSLLPHHPLCMLTVSINVFYHSKLNFFCFLLLYSIKK